MKQTMFLIAAALLVIAPAHATYDQALAQCNAFAKANDTSADPCVCIAKAIGDKPDLLAEQGELTTMDDFQGASDELHAAINPCLPPDKQAK